MQQVLTTEKSPSPPVPTTAPPQSRYSTSSAESASSGASKAEYYTQDAATAFLWNTYDTIEEAIEMQAWYGERYRLRFSGFSSPAGLTQSLGNNRT